MFCHSTHRAKEPGLPLTLCLVGLFLFIFALRAHGQQVHQLSFDGSSWMDQDLNGAVAAPYTGIASFLTTPNDQTHVYYVDNTGDYHVHQLFFNGVSWSDQDLTVATGAAQGAYAACQVAGFSVGNYQYVYYFGNDTHVHQMLYNNIGWSDVDLTALTGGPSAQAAPLVAFTTSPALHVYYVDWNLHIRQLFSDDGTNWQDQDLTSLTGVSSAGQMSGFNVDNYQYLYVIASGGHIHELLYNNIGWSDEDLTVLSKSTPAKSGVQAILIPGTKKMCVLYISTDNHIVELTATDNKKWGKTDLSKKSLAPGPQSDHIAAFTAPPHNGLHVFYIGYTTNFHVLQIYKPKAQPWTYQDMTALTNGGIPETPYSYLAGFSLQSDQYVYYVAK